MVVAIFNLNIDLATSMKRDRFKKFLVRIHQERE